MGLEQRFWEGCYERNIGKMIGLCYRYVANRQVAEDLAHDAFLKAMQKAESFKGKGQFEAWLRRITVNTALQYLRDEKGKHDRLRELADRETGSDSIEEESDMDKGPDFSTQELMGIIMKLPEHHRLVFNLYVIDRYSHKQIAEMLNMSEGTSKSHLARARKGLKIMLQEEAEEKNKKRRRHVLFAILPFGPGREDRLFRGHFANYKLPPRRTIEPGLLNRQAAPAIRPRIRIGHALAMAGLGAAVLSAVFFGPADTDKAPGNKSPETIADSLLRKTEPAIAAKKKALPLSDSSDQVPVVIRKQRVVHKTLVIRDTIEIVDSSHVH